MWTCSATRQSSGRYRLLTETAADPMCHSDLATIIHHLCHAGKWAYWTFHAHIKDKIHHSSVMCTLCASPRIHKSKRDDWKAPTGLLSPACVIFSHFCSTLGRCPPTQKFICHDFIFKVNSRRSLYLASLHRSLHWLVSVWFSVNLEHISEHIWQVGEEKY